MVATRVQARSCSSSVSGPQITDNAESDGKRMTARRTTVSSSSAGAGWSSVSASSKGMGAADARRPPDVTTSTGRFS